MYPTGSVTLRVASGIPLQDVSVPMYDCFGVLDYDLISYRTSAINVIFTTPVFCCGESYSRVESWRGLIDIRDRIHAGLRG